MAYSQLPPLGQAAKAASLPVTLASNEDTLPVSAASLPLPSGASTSTKQDTGNTSLASIDGKITAVNTGAVVISSGNVTADTELTTADLDTGAGTDTRAVVGIVGSKSGGAQLIPGDATAGLKVDLGADNDVTVTNSTATNLKAQAECYQGGSAVASGNPLQVTLANTGANATAVKVDGSAVTQPVSLASVPSHAVTNAGTFAVQATEADGANATLGAKADAKSTATDTTAVTAMQVLKEISYMEQNPASRAVTNSGTFAVQATAVGTVADDATTPGNPVMIGGKAVETDGTDPTSVSAEDDVTILRTDRNRRLLVNIAHPRMTSASENNSTAQTNNPILSAPGANLSLYITDIVVSNGATAGSIKFVEDTAGTPVVKVQETYMAINGGAVMHFLTPIRITANKDFGYTSTTVTTHSITVSGYISP